MTLIKVYNWNKYYLFTLDLPDPFPKGIVFPYDGKKYIVVEHGFEPIEDEKNGMQLADLVLIVDSIGD